MGPMIMEKARFNETEARSFLHFFLSSGDVSYGECARHIENGALGEELARACDPTIVKNWMHQYPVFHNQSS
jgi:hypothetical protein